MAKSILKTRFVGREKWISEDPLMKQSKIDGWKEKNEIDEAAEWLKKQEKDQPKIVANNPEFDLTLTFPVGKFLYPKDIIWNGAEKALVVKKCTSFTKANGLVQRGCLAYMMKTRETITKTHYKAFTAKMDGDEVSVWRVKGNR